MAQALVFIGLGNPGKKYVYTRHNMGFLVVEEFAKSLGVKLKEDQHFNAKVGKIQVNGRDIYFLLPMTYMNESGQAVERYLAYYKLEPAQAIVVHDDIAFDLGAMRLSSMGSSGGHNGLKSIAAHLGTQEFHRLRMGIGSQKGQATLADYVLSGFTAMEMAMLNEIVAQGTKVLKELTIEPVTQVMGRINTKVTFRPQDAGQENKHEPNKNKPL